MAEQPRPSGLLAGAQAHPRLSWTWVGVAEAAWGGFLGAEDRRASGAGSGVLFPLQSSEHVEPDEEESSGSGSVPGGGHPSRQRP